MAIEYLGTRGTVAFKFVDYTLKVLGKSVGFCKTTKRKDQVYISLLVSVWRIICENFNPNGLILAEIWMKKKKRKKKKGLWFWRSVTVTLSHHYHRYFLQWLFLSKILQYLGFLDTIDSDNTFTISPLNLALLHFYPPTLLPSTFNIEIRVKLQRRTFLPIGEVGYILGDSSWDCVEIITIVLVELYKHDKGKNNL